MIKVLILGATGMLGHKLVQTMPEPFEVWATIRGKFDSIEKFGIFERDRIIEGVDAGNFVTIQAAIDSVRPDVVVNCIGIVKQQALGKDPIACITINALLPHLLATACQNVNARLIHISTDCVFDGEKGSYVEDDLTNATDLYGRSKAMGETTSPNALTIRTSIIGRELTTNLGLVDWFLGQRGGFANGFTQAIFSGFTTNELSRVIQRVILDHPNLSGLYQVSSSPIDKYTLLKLLNDAYDAHVEISPSDALKIDRSLVSIRFKSTTGYESPTWPQMIGEMAADKTPYENWKQPHDSCK